MRERERERERERDSRHAKNARARAENERETEGKEEESPRTGLHAGLADVDGNNLSHFWWCCSWWFFLGMCSGKETKRLMSLRVLLERGKSAKYLFLSTDKKTKKERQNPKLKNPKLKRQKEIPSIRNAKD